MALRTFNWCSVCNYKFRKNKSPSDFHNRNCNNRQFYDFGLCHHCLEEHRISGICNQTMYFGDKLSSDFNETGKSGVSSSFPNDLIFDSLHTKESLSQLDDQNLLFSFYDESISLTSNTSRQGEEETELSEIIGLDNDTMHYPEYQDRTSGFISKESMKIPRPFQFQLPKKPFTIHASNRIRTHGKWEIICKCSYKYRCDGQITYR